MKIEIKKAIFGNFIIKDCCACRKAFDYQITNVNIDGINSYLCDECLQELNRKIVDYLADKNI